MKGTAQLCFVVILHLLTSCRGKYVLQPGAFLKLPNRNGNYGYNNGAANKADYDPLHNLLYVIAHKTDLLHIVNMTDPSNPRLVATKLFDAVDTGFPDSIKVCRSETAGYLAISFESKDQVEHAHTHLYHLYDPPNLGRPLEDFKTPTTLEGFDPKAMAWKRDCSKLVVLTEGDPHNGVGGAFIDPPGTVDVLQPTTFGDSVDRLHVGISEADLIESGVRHIFRQCDAGSTEESSRVQDLEPKTVVVDNNDMAYIVFQENNAVGVMDLKQDLGTIGIRSYHDLGRKRWANYGLDGAYNDAGVLLKPRNVESFYQPGAMVSFQLAGRTFLATADTGSIRTISLSNCTFDVSSNARTWNQAISSRYLTPDEVTQLTSSMKNAAEIGLLRISKLKKPSDGWNANTQMYDFVCTFGGRGFSVLDPATMTRVYDSGDDFERYFATPAATEPQTAVFNGNVGLTNTQQSSQFDRASPWLGPTPSAIAALRMDDNTQVIVIANGLVGGMYLYSVTAAAAAGPLAGQAPGTDPALARTAPTVTFQGFVRRGQAGLTWGEGYARADDAVGEPYVTDMISFDDEGHKTVVAVSSYAGAISVYSVQQVP